MRWALLRNVVAFSSFFLGMFAWSSQDIRLLYLYPSSLSHLEKEYDRATHKSRLQRYMLKCVTVVKALNNRNKK